VNPAAGPVGGGNAVTITGTGFAAATTLFFGNTPAPQFAINSNTSITATVPAGMAGAVDVQVQDPFGLSAISPADQDTYQAVAPAVAAVAPANGPVAGGNQVTIEGNNFEGVSQVLFGSVAATKVIVVSPTTLFVTAPALPPGTVDVTVSTPYGASTT